MFSLRLEHIGWAVEDIEAALPSFAALGFEPCTGGITEDAGRDVRIILLRNSDGAEVELVSPMSDGSPVSGVLKKNGPSPYHCCFDADTDDPEARIAELRSAGFMVISRPSPAPALGGDCVAFLYSKFAGLIELQFKIRNSG